MPKSGDDIIMHFRRVAAEALNEEAAELLDESEAEVPVGIGPDNGELMRSGRVEEATPENLEAEVVYGGENIPYAAAQHEGEAEMLRGGQVVHWEVKQYSQPGRKKHYLSDPLKARAAGIDERVSQRISRKMG